MISLNYQKIFKNILTIIIPIMFCNGVSAVETQQLPDLAIAMNSTAKLLVLAADNPDVCNDKNISGLLSGNKATCTAIRKQFSDNLLTAINKDDMKASALTTYQKNFSAACAQYLAQIKKIPVDRVSFERLLKRPMSMSLDNYKEVLNFGQQAGCTRAGAGAEGGSSGFAIGNLSGSGGSAGAGAGSSAGRSTRGRGTTGEDQDRSGASGANFNVQTPGSTDIGKAGAGGGGANGSSSPITDGLCSMAASLSPGLANSFAACKKPAIPTVSDCGSLREKAATDPYSANQYIIKCCQNNADPLCSTGGGNGGAGGGGSSGGNQGDGGGGLIPSGPSSGSCEEQIQAIEYNNASAFQATGCLCTVAAEEKNLCVTDSTCSNLTLIADQDLVAKFSALCEDRSGLPPIPVIAPVSGTFYDVPSPSQPIRGLDCPGGAESCRQAAIAWRNELVSKYGRAQSDAASSDTQVWRGLSCYLESREAPGSFDDRSAEATCKSVCSYAGPVNVVTPGDNKPWVVANKPGTYVFWSLRPNGWFQSVDSGRFYCSCRICSESSANQDPGSLVFKERVSSTQDIWHFPYCGDCNVGGNPGDPNTVITVCNNLERSADQCKNYMTNHCQQGGFVNVQVSGTTSLQFICKK